MLNHKKIAIIGTGNMGEALISGLIVSGSSQPENIICTDVMADKLEEIAGTYEKPEEVIKAYSENRELMQSLEGAVLEDQVVDVLMKQADIQDKNMTFDELMNPEKG